MVHFEISNTHGKWELVRKNGSSSRSNRLPTSRSLLLFLSPCLLLFIFWTCFIFPEFQSWDDGFWPDKITVWWCLAAVTICNRARDEFSCHFTIFIVVVQRISCADTQLDVPSAVSWAHFLCLLSTCVSLCCSLSSFRCGTRARASSLPSHISFIIFCLRILYPSCIYFGFKQFLCSQFAHTHFASLLSPLLSLFNSGRHTGFRVREISLHNMTIIGEKRTLDPVQWHVEK